MHIIKNSQDLDVLLEEICEKESDGGGYWEDMDKIILYTKGKWFDKNVLSALTIWGAAPPVKSQYSTKIEPEDKPYIKNTISYIQNNFDHIYQVMLETLIPFVQEWGMENKTTHEVVTTIEQLNEARDKDELIDGMETRSLDLLQLNCAYKKEDMVFYSLIFLPDCCEYGYDDGFEVVFWKDHVVYFTDGNTAEAILDFDYYKDTDTYFGVPS